MLFGFLSFILAHHALAQDPYVDSLTRVLKRSNLPDTQRVLTLNELAWSIQETKQAEAKAILVRSVQLARKIKYPKGLAEALNNEAVLAAMNSDSATAIKKYLEALNLRQQIQDSKGIGSIYNNLGNLYNDYGNYFKAIEFHKLSYQTQIAIKDTVRVSRAAFNLSKTYWRLGDYPTALNYMYQYLKVSEQLEDPIAMARGYDMLGNIQGDINFALDTLKMKISMASYQKALKYWKQENDESGVASTMNNIGVAFDDLGDAVMKQAKDYAAAMRYFKLAEKTLLESLQLQISLADESSMSEVYNNLGVVAKHIGSLETKMSKSKESKTTFEKALSYFGKALEICKKNEDARGRIEVYNGMGDVYRRLKQYKISIGFVNQYLELALKTGDKKFEQMAYKDLSEVHSEMGNYAKAYQYRIKYETVKDLRINETNLLKFQQDEFSFKEEQKLREIEEKKNQIELNKAQLKSAAMTRNSLFGGSLLLILLAGVLFNRNKIKTKANQELSEKNELIEAERKKSDQLLLNILPETTAAELKATGKAKAKNYDSVTVLFTDFKNFTAVSEQLNAEQLVAELNKCFMAFDEITDRHNLEKIKTIGDAYMCAGGIPETNSTHPIDAVSAGLEMVKAMIKYQEERIKEGQPIFQVRVGIHTGPLVAGVVGTKKFAYDIWGDTVNTASRMESSGEPDRVNVSEATWELVKDQFEGEHRGKIAAKNKGNIDMYFITEKKNT